MSFSVAELAELVDGEVRGDPELRISGGAKTGEAKPGEIAFLGSPEQLADALREPGACLIVTPQMETGSSTVICVEHPKLAFARILQKLYPAKDFPPGVHATAVVEDGVRLGRGVHIGAHAQVCSGAVLGDDVVIGAGSVVEENVHIGRDTILRARVIVYPEVVIGERVVVHAGSVLGTESFGFVTHAGGHEKFPQVGELIIGDDVEIGANCTLDRGAIGATIVGTGTKLGNLVEVAHNVEVGEHCLLCTQVGIAGSTKIGDRVILLGQVGIADHAHLEDGVIIGAQGGIATGKTVRAGQFLAGSPARPVHDYRREYAALSRLPKLLRTVSALKRKLGLASDEES